MTGVTRRELTIALAWSVFVMLVTTVPYLAGRRLAGPRYFSGFVSAVDDGNVYLQWIRQASEGAWTLGNQYSTEPQHPLTVNVFLLALGRVAGALHLAPIQVFHAARLACGCLCLVSFFLLVSALTPDPAIRWTSLLLASLSSGFGWLFDMLYSDRLPPVQPIDYGPRWVYQPEAITFLSLVLNPLFCFSLALICLTLFCALRGLDGGRVGWAVLAGLLLLVLGNVHTYDLPVVHLTLVGWIVVGLLTGRVPWTRGGGHYLLILLVSLAAPLWQFHVLQADPVYRAKADTATLSGPYLNYLFGYGLVWFLAVAGAAWVLLRGGGERPRLALAVVWAVAATAVLYAPIPSQRKLAEGLHFPLCLLAATAVAKLIGGWMAQRAFAGRGVEGRLFFAAVAVTLLCLPSNVLFFGDCLRSLRTNNAELARVLMPPLYLQPGEHDALGELGRRTRHGDVVMSSSMMGNYIPAHTRSSVVAGHWAETVNLLPLPGGGHTRLDFPSYALPATFRFFSARSTPAEKAALLLRFRVTYVLCGPTEEAMYAADGPGAAPSAGGELAKLPFLERVYEANGISLLRVMGRGALLEAARGPAGGPP